MRDVREILRIEDNRLIPEVRFMCLNREQQLIKISLCTKPTTLPYQVVNVTSVGVGSFLVVSGLSYFMQSSALLGSKQAQEVHVFCEMFE